jgi:hypothetical protein
MNGPLLAEFGGETEEPKQTIPSSFKRQLVMLVEIQKVQENCYHELVQPNKTVIACARCGAIWIK